MVCGRYSCGRRLYTFICTLSSSAQTASLLRYLRVRTVCESFILSHSTYCKPHCGRPAVAWPATSFHGSSLVTKIGQTAKLMCRLLPGLLLGVAASASLGVGATRRTM